MFQMKKMIFYTAILAVLFGCTAFAADGEPGTVTADVLNLREEPNTSASVVKQLKRGQKVTIIAEKDGFYSVISGGDTGYASAQYVRPKSDEVLKKLTEDVYFYDGVKGEFTTVEKSFYRGKVGSGERRFDSMIDEWALQMESSGSWVVSDELNALTKKMGKALFKSDSVRTTIVYGQYYPYEKDAKGKTYATGIHEGIDFAGPERNAPFYSLTDGEVIVKVVEGSSNKDYHYIGVKTGDHTVFYIHGSKYYVNVGDKVKKGQKLGLQGDMGAPGAYHVHLELDAGSAKTFKRSKNTVLENESPYEFWLDQVA